MFRNTEPLSVAPPPPTPPDSELSPFLANIAKYRNYPVAVHTGADVYTGRLTSVTPVWVVLDSDSDVLDARVAIHVDASRIEAVEVLSR